MGIKTLIYAVAQVVLTIGLAVTIYEAYQFVRAALKKLF